MLASIKPGSNFLWRPSLLAIAHAVVKTQPIAIPFANCASFRASWWVGCERAHCGILPHLQRGVDQAPSYDDSRKSSYDEVRGVSQEHVEQEVLVGVGDALEIEGVRRVRSPEAPKMTIVEGWESVWTFHRSSSYLGAAARAHSQARTRAARCRAAIRVGSSQEPSWRTPLIKNVGVPLTPLRTPLMKSSRTR
jgi:hypothetical protein